MRFLLLAALIPLPAAAQTRGVLAVEAAPRVETPLSPAGAALTAPLTPVNPLSLPVPGLTVTAKAPLVAQAPVPIALAATAIPAPFAAEHSKLPVQPAAVPIKKDKGEEGLFAEQSAMFDGSGAIGEIDAALDSRDEVRIDAAYRKFYQARRDDVQGANALLVADLNRRSDLKKAALAAIPDGHPARVYDAVFIGAGVNGGVAKAAFLKSLPENVPGARVLTLEKEKAPSIFGRIGGQFFGNTLEHKAPGALHNPSVSEEDLKAASKNYLPGAPVQVYHLAKGHVPAAYEFAAPAIATHHRWGGDLLFGSAATTVEPVDPAKPDGLKRVRTADGEVFYSKVVVYGPGLGEGKLPSTDPKSVEFVRSEESKPDPTVEFLEPWMEKLESDRSHSSVAGKTLIFFGGGHGSAIGVEATLGLGPKPLAEGTRKPAKIIVVGFPKTGAEFKATIGGGSRYYGLAPLIDDGTIESFPYYVDAVLPAGKGRIKVTLLDKRTKQPVLDGKGKRVVLVGDKGVYATGYESVGDKLFGAFAGENGVNRRTLIGRIEPNDPRVRKDDAAVGVEILDAQGRGTGVFLVGPGAGKLANPDDPGGSASVVMNVYAPRSESLGRLAAEAFLETLQRRP